MARKKKRMKRPLKGSSGVPYKRPAARGPRPAPRPGSRNDLARRKEARRSRVKGALALAGGLGLVVLSLVLVLVVRPGQVAEEREFRAALPCAAAAAGPEDCLRTEEATVRKARIETSGKSTYRDAELVGPASVAGRVDFEDDGPLLELLHPGDEVQAVVWRGEVVELTAWGFRQPTTDSPLGASLDTAILAVMTSGSSAAAFGYAWWALNRWRSSKAGP